MNDENRAPDHGGNRRAEKCAPMGRKVLRDDKQPRTGELNMTSNQKPPSCQKRK